MSKENCNVLRQQRDKENHPVYVGINQPSPVICQIQLHKAVNVAVCLRHTDCSLLPWYLILMSSKSNTLP